MSQSYIIFLNKLRDIADKIKDNLGEIEEIKTLIRNIDTPVEPEIERLMQEKEMEIDNRKQQEDSMLINFQAEIDKLISNEKIVRNREPIVDRNHFIEKSQNELNKITELEEMFVAVSDAFDRMFGSSKARQIVEEHLRCEIDFDDMEIMEELLSLSNKLEPIKSSLERISGNIHSDSYSKVVSYIFPNIGQIIPDLGGNLLLLTYVLYYMLFLILMLYYPIFVTLPLTALVVVSMIISATNYSNLIQSFIKAFRIKTIVNNAEEIVTMNIAKKVEEEKNKQRQRNNKQADDLLKEIQEKERHLINMRSESKMALESFRKSINKEYEEKINHILESRKELDSKILEYRKDIKKYEDEISLLKKERSSLIEEIGNTPGITKPLSIREEILNPNILLGVNKERDNIVTLNIDEPTLVMCSEDKRIPIAKLIISQLMNRMVPSKIHIYLYDPNQLGMEFVSFINEGYKEWGLQILSNQAQFKEFMDDLDINLRNFKFTLSEFGTIQAYNEYMYSNNSVTREYYIVMLMEIPNDLQISGYSSNLGVHWLCFDNREDEKVIEMINNNFHVKFKV